MLHFHSSVKFVCQFKLRTFVENLFTDFGHTSRTCGAPLSTLSTEHVKNLGQLSTC